MPTAELLQKRGVFVEICRANEVKTVRTADLITNNSYTNSTFWEVGCGLQCCDLTLPCGYPVEPKPPAPRAVSSRSFAQAACGVMIFSMMSWQILLPAESWIAVSLVL